MAPRTSIHALSDDILIRILWRYNQPAPPTICKPDSDDVWESLGRRPKYVTVNLPDEKAILSVYRPPLPPPPPFTDVPLGLRIASVCRRWRSFAKRHVTTLVVKENLVFSFRELSAAVACFPSLTYLQLCDNSVETLDDTFLTHLASSCPKLTSLHVGHKITQDMKYDARKELHPITEDGLDQFFLQCTQLEELSLFCLHQDIRLPPSFFQLTRLRTVALTDASALESPSLGNFRCLTSLYIASQKISQQQLSGLVRLPSLNNLSIYNYTRLIRNEQRAAAIAIAQIPRLKSLEFRVMFPSGTPCTNLERLRITSSRHLDRLPDRIGDLLPNLRELNFRFCELFFHLPQDFTSLNSLESLVISMCNSFSRLPEDFGRLPALKTLVLDELPRLCHLPASLSELSSLETLFLIGSPEIRQLPAGFCSLTGLKTLCLMKMPGIVLPEGIGGLSSLQTFLLNDNDHHQLLPASFTQLSSLTRLELSKITMDNLPADIGNLIRLRQLHVHCCTVNELPESLTSLSKLEVLTFVECRELMVPSGLENLRKLKRLELPCEPPQPLPPSLEVLTLGSKKNFTSLPDIAMPASLQKLSFTFVEMQSGGMVLSRSLANLQHLELVLDESVKAIPFPLISLPHLRTLEILSAGILEELPSNIGSAMPQLRQLLIHEADSLTELPASVTQLQHLTSLEVWAPKLASVPHDIGALSQLRRLDLSNCLALEQLPSSLTQLSCLHELVLKNTSIRSLPPSFAHLTRLRTLNLNKCKQLAALPEDLTELRMLHRLDVGGCRQFLDRGGVRALAASSMYGLRIDRE